MKFNDSVVLGFLECICYIQNLVFRQNEPVSQMCVAHFLTLTIELYLVRFGGSASFTFELYIAHYRPHLRCCY